MATAKSTPAEIIEIQRRMAQVRHELHEEVREAVKGAQSLTDWRSQVRNHPWLAMGAAAALGYMIVPRRRQEPAPAIVAVAPAVAGPAVVQPSPAVPAKKRWGLIGSALGLLAPIAVRAAQNYAIQYLEQWIAAQPPGAGPTPFGSGLSPGAPASGGGPGSGPRGPRPSGSPGRPRDISMMALRRRRELATGNWQLGNRKQTEGPTMISIARNQTSSQSREQGAAGEAIAQAREYLADAREIVKDVIHNRPALALGVALAAGVLLGWLIKRR